MTRMFVNTKIRLRLRPIEAREAGQGTPEYLGIVVVVPFLLVGALITAFTAFDLGGQDQHNPRQENNIHPRTPAYGTEKRRPRGPVASRRARAVPVRVSVTRSWHRRILVG